MQVSNVVFRAKPGILSKIAKSDEIAAVLERAANNGKLTAGFFGGVSYRVKTYQHNKFRARAVVFADAPEHGRSSDLMRAALRVHPRV